MKNSFKYIVSAAFGLSLVLFIAACGKDDTSVPTSGRVRFFNAVSDAPAAGMDLIIDGTIVNLRNWLTAGTPVPDSTFKYGAGFPISTDSSYFYLTEGNHNVKLNAVGTATNSLSADIAVAAGKSYTVFATDTLSKISAVVATDVVLAPVDKKAVFRFAHMVQMDQQWILRASKARIQQLFFPISRIKQLHPLSKWIHRQALFSLSKWITLSVWQELKLLLVRGQVLLSLMAVFIHS
jgi:hypothetical protein